MPLKLVPPREGRSTSWRIRGTYLGRSVDRTAGTPDKATARRHLKAIERQIERGAFADPAAPGWASAALSYLNAGGEDRFLSPITEAWQDKPLAEIDQAALDALAVELYPERTAATRNRCVYTPVSAVLRHAGVEIALKRPKGAQGMERHDWLWPEQAHALFTTAAAIDRELAVLLVLLCYTGLRLGEAIRLRCSDVRLAEAFAFAGKTKNGDPRPIHLPPAALAELANHPRGLDRGDARVFRWTDPKDHALYALFDLALAAAAIVLPPRLRFHVFRHTYGTWMRKYGGLSREGLVDTGVWRSANAARRYDHVEVSEAARKADLLPVPTIRRKA